MYWQVDTTERIKTESKGACIVVNNKNNVVVSVAFVRGCGRLEAFKSYIYISRIFVFAALRSAVS